MAPNGRAGPHGAPILVTVPLATALSACIDDGSPRDDRADEAQTAVVVAQHYLATEAGARMLRAGGNAIDAAAAIQWANTVVEPQFSGIGGGAFIVYYDAEAGTVTTLDGRETAPAAATADQFAPGPDGRRLDHTVMGTAVGVPGTVRLFEEALDRWGTMTMAATLQPAVGYAEDGFEVTPYFAEVIETYRYRLETWPAAAELYLPGSVCVPSQAGFRFVGYDVPRCTGGDPPGAGSTLRNPDLAATLRLLQDDGPSAFYAGPVAEAIVATAAERDGRLTMGDFAGYAVTERAPSVSGYLGHEVYTMDMPSSALTMQQILAMVEGDDLAAMGAGSADATHLLVEAMHLAYADRAAFMGDEDFVQVPKAGLLHPVYVAERRDSIDMTRAATDVAPGNPWSYEEGDSEADVAPGEGQGRPAHGPPPSGGIEGHHTSHFVVVDHQGNIASVTTTIEHVFGTGMLVPGFGFFLNNELTDFDWEPGGPNEVQPGKRPRSSMSPAIVFADGEPVFALGSPGGSTIITTVLQGIVNRVAHGMDVESVVAAPRVYSAAYPNVLVEPGFGADVEAELESRGHTLVPRERIGFMQAAVRGDDGAWVGAADPRGIGSALYVPPSAVAS